MDSDQGRFVSDEEAKAWMTRYELGETVKVKDNEFKILSIEERRIVLEPIARSPFSALFEEGDDLNRHERRRREALMRKGSV